MLRDWSGVISGSDYLKPYSGFRGLLGSLGRRHYARRRCERVILVPGRPYGPPHLEEVSVEVLYTQPIRPGCVRDKDNGSAGVSLGLSLL